MKSSLNEKAPDLIFAPPPENDFAQYIQTYYQVCRNHFDGVEAIAGKWMYRDLLPGMSDFDARLIVRDGMTDEDWCRMSRSIGEAHLELCTKHPSWARNLEHLPGINVGWSELLSESTYYPEYQQWSFYHSEKPSRIAQVMESLANRRWDSKDEYFQLKKFCLYFGRYNRTIDPPINLGLHESKYPLHSRLMHYFTPAVQSAISILQKQNVAGKFEALELAALRWPHLECWESVVRILSARYAVPEWYREPLLTRLEDQLEDALRAIAVELADFITLIPAHLRREPEKWKSILQDVEIDPALIIIERLRFSRLMKGRLQFYAAAPARFNTTWLIGNELRRIGRDFFRIPFQTYWKIKTGERDVNPLWILERLEGELLTRSEIAATAEFARLTPGSWELGAEKQIALAIANVFDEFFSALIKLTQSVHRIQNGIRRK